MRCVDPSSFPQEKVNRFKERSGSMFTVTLWCHGSFFGSNKYSQVSELVNSPTYTCGMLINFEKLCGCFPLTFPLNINETTKKSVFCLRGSKSIFTVPACRVQNMQRDVWQSITLREVVQWYNYCTVQNAMQTIECQAAKGKKWQTVDKRWDWMRRLMKIRLTVNCQWRCVFLFVNMYSCIPMGR